VVLLSRFRRQVNDQLLRTGGAVRMTEGVRVRIRGSVEVYGPRSEIQLRMTAIDPSYTLASLGLERDRVLRALADAGLLELNGRLPVPFLPLRIAVLTSLGSAAHADCVDELARSGFGFEVSAFDVRVQGPHAAGTIVRAIERAAGHVAIVRGGGCAHRSGGVRRRVVGVPWPLRPRDLVGVGHETDTGDRSRGAHGAQDPDRVRSGSSTPCAPGRRVRSIMDAGRGCVGGARSGGRRLARRVVGVSARSTGARRRGTAPAAARLAWRPPLWRLDQADERLGAVRNRCHTPRAAQSADASLAAIATTVRVRPRTGAGASWSIAAVATAASLEHPTCVPERCCTRCSSTARCDRLSTPRLRWPSMARRTQQPGRGRLRRSDAGTRDIVRRLDDDAPTSTPRRRGGTGGRTMPPAANG
jgi:exodeoxyribonuclease VII large subunit